MVASHGVVGRALSSPRRAWNPPAFTLIEILVVVAIVALLVAILLPAMGRARDQARNLQCGTNLRTINQATLYYAQANQDSMPSSGSSFERIHMYLHKTIPLEKYETHPFGGPGWYVFVEYYLCPMDRIPHLTGELERRQPDGTTIQLEYATSYGINSRVASSKRRIGSVRQPSTIVQFCDSGDDDFYGGGPWYLSEQNGKTNQVGHELHHRTGNQFVYFDGHVAFSKFIRTPPQYGLPSFPHAWIPEWKPGYGDGVYDNYVRPGPVP